MPEAVNPGGCSARERGQRGQAARQRAAAAAAARACTSYRERVINGTLAADAMFSGAMLRKRRVVVVRRAVWRQWRGLLLTYRGR